MDKRPKQNQRSNKCEQVGLSQKLQVHKSEEQKVNNAKRFFLD